MILSLAREFGWKKASSIVLFEVGFAILIGGLAFRFLSHLM
jgi:hypothetical protein